MPKFKALFIVSVILIYCFSACQSKPSNTLKIATAANMQFAMDSLIDVFQQKTNIECETIVASSGKLTAQIMAGAPFDIFISADIKYPNTLFEKGFALEKPKIYANGTLVLWTNLENTEPSIALLSNKEIKHITIANPKTAPYGFAAEEFLNKMGILDSLKQKVVFGESISAVNRYIYSRSADVGFTAKSVVLSPQMKNQGKWLELDPTLYSPIEQGALLLKSSNQENSENAKKFYEFLFSEEAKNILNKYGYQTQ